MDERDFAFLKELVATPSPSGFEQPVQRILRRKLEGVADKLRTDVMGTEGRFPQGYAGRALR